MNKHAIRQSFDRAAGSYDSVATLQRQVCELLLAVLPAPTFSEDHHSVCAEPPQANATRAGGATRSTLKPTHPVTNGRSEQEITPREGGEGGRVQILDAGCGTGFALDLLARRWPQARLVAADFAPAMLAGITGERIGGDIEALPFRPATFDIYWSSLAIQWCDARRAVAEAARVLKPGGRFAVSSLGTGTLAELTHAFAAVDQHRHVLEFSPEQMLAAACAAAGLHNIRLETRQIRRFHPDLKSLLRALKALGANQVGAGRRPGLFGRRVWQSVEARYEALRETDGLPATYEVLLCTAIK